MYDADFMVSKNEKEDLLMNIHIEVEGLNIY